MKGAGVTRKGVTGDLIVSVEVAVPQKLSAAAKEALEAFAQGAGGRSARGDHPGPAFAGTVRPPRSPS